jgi:cobalt-precorrin 5A hydrolase
MGEAVIVAGVGCRKGAAATDIEAAISAALERCGVATEALGLIATSMAKGAEAGIVTAASALGVPVVLVSQGALEDAGHRTATKSERVLLRTGVPSLAEAAALAAAGPAARLIAPRVAVGPATCALAQSTDAPRDAA